MMTRAFFLTMASAVAAAVGCGRSSLLVDEDGHAAGIEGNHSSTGDASLEGTIDASSDASRDGSDLGMACSGRPEVLVFDPDGAAQLVFEGKAVTVRVVAVFDGLPADIVIASSDGEWSVEVSSVALGRALYPGSYENTERAGFADPGRAGLELEGQGTDFGGSGSFQVLGSSVSAFSVVFSVSSFDGNVKGCANVRTP